MKEVGYEGPITFDAFIKDAKSLDDLIPMETQVEWIKKLMDDFLSELLSVVNEKQWFNGGEMAYEAVQDLEFTRGYVLQMLGEVADAASLMLDAHKDRVLLIDKTRWEHEQS